MTSLNSTWHDLMENKSDQRVKDWPFMSSPVPTGCICIAYVIFAKVIGPKLMENRKPFQLRNTLIIYNFLQVLVSLKIFIDASRYGWLTTYNWRCEPLDTSTSPAAMNMVIASYLYYLSKFTEFFDTIFFIMRKRFDQVSTLHVVHHGIMPFSTWWGIKFSPGGHGSFFGFLNSGVHVVMYTYYMLAAIGPQMQKYLWWKKYLTILQLVQFVAVMVHAFQLFFYNPCGYPTYLAWVLLVHAIMFFVLFKAFYNEAYSKPKSDHKKNDDIKDTKQGH